MILVPREAQNLPHRRFSYMLNPFERASKTVGWDIFLLEIGDLTKAALFPQVYFGGEEWGCGVEDVG